MLTAENTMAIFSTACGPSAASSPNFSRATSKKPCPFLRSFWLRMQ